ncbi:MAG: Glycosyl transferase family 2 [Microgenomates group bacterium GW2011_GWC1_43_11]|uniref:Glycosyl transferase family 2 n=2 Tax=Candidatus Gottesmaniibacteriota TaxID=1752720 RepID=A0A0G1IR61_9BACT|nr:MAG: Glycosyl transferase family 2 [Microgenomates group bacterium GW2011_GWC1_43_11]KKT39137.1 MAG: Glycosyl transferase family 2 [Candidatus Gottesmanbacteria bacterium GW2011_GWB1_44_11c]KKT61610.1 MAG: Glycosyl transferase family 2 [Candidatus Gottesmanbacteria bacterium GW2011_GWA1_44_24b]HCM82193.1 glycosyl transferase [Patescibacteria group bacterium]
MNKLSIIIPVYNEERTVDAILGAVESWKKPGWVKEVIVVDDGSSDKTPMLLKKWQKINRIIYKIHNEGKGSAIIEGLKYASGDLVLIQDADLEYNPKDYETLLSPFDNPHVDVVYGSRFLGPHLSTMYMYALGNKFVTFITNILYNTNITDMETGYKVFRRKVIDGMTLKAKRFDFEPEFTAKILKKGYQIYEVPISYFGRKFEEGKKLTWIDGVVALWTLIKNRV